MCSRIFLLVERYLFTLFLTSVKCRYLFLVEQREFPENRISIFTEIDTSSDSSSTPRGFSLNHAPSNISYTRVEILRPPETRQSRDGWSLHIHCSVSHLFIDYHSAFKFCIYKGTQVLSWSTFGRLSAVCNLLFTMQYTLQSSSSTYISSYGSQK